MKGWSRGGFGSLLAECSTVDTTIDMSVGYYKCLLAFLLPMYLTIERLNLLMGKPNFLSD